MVWVKLTTHFAQQRIPTDSMGAAEEIRRILLMGGKFHRIVQGAPNDANLGKHLHRPFLLRMGAEFPDPWLPGLPTPRQAAYARPGVNLAALAGEQPAKDGSFGREGYDLFTTNEVWIDWPSPTAAPPVVGQVVLDRLAALRRAATQRGRRERCNCGESSAAVDPYGLGLPL